MTNTSYEVTTIDRHGEVDLYVGNDEGESILAASRMVYYYLERGYEVSRRDLDFAVKWTVHRSEVEGPVFIYRFTELGN